MTIRFILNDEEIALDALPPSIQSLKVRLTNDHVVECRFLHHTYEALSLEPGEPVQLSLRKEGLRILEQRRD